ncbi:hypothetical protein KAI87_16780, partial [Myxococcota bacterium]|nr:hypothetical protein [Myxococcota bacterium]
HFDFYRFRAVENDRWMLRVANSGVTAVIDHLGQIKKQTLFHQKDMLVADVQLREGQTLYGILGDWPPYLALLLLILAWLYEVYSRRRQQAILDSYVGEAADLVEETMEDGAIMDEGLENPPVTP